MLPRIVQRLRGSHVQVSRPVQFARIQDRRVPSLSTPATTPGTVRLPEAENALLDVLDDRGVGIDQTVPLVEIEVAMDARGYAVRWVRRAVEALVSHGVLRHAGGGAVQRLGSRHPTTGPRRLRRRAGGRQIFSGL
jgi:hypothetical protein